MQLNWKVLAPNFEVLTGNLAHPVLLESLPFGRPVGMLANKGAKLSRSVLNAGCAQRMARACAAAECSREQMAPHNSPLNLSSSTQTFPRAGGKKIGLGGEEKC